MEREKRIIKIQQFDWASVLMASGYQLEEIEWQDGVAKFLFVDDKENSGEELIKKYNNGKIFGSYKKLIEAQRTLKQMIKS